MSDEVKEQYTKASIQVGRYSLWDSGDKIGIIDLDTGEAGMFEKEEFLPYVEAFFGLNYD